MVHRLRISFSCAALVVASGNSSAQELPSPCLSCAGGPATFVTSGSANYVVSGNVGTITQHSDRAILNWRTFNIGADSTVNFLQPSSTSAALNRIFQNDPSKIFGALNANGQVYLINQNGIVFGQGAQVNTRALVASTLNIGDDIFSNLGLTGAINAGNSVNDALPAFSGNSDGEIRVEDGAKIKVGERVMLIGANVVNAGTIEAPDGQAILAASHDKVYLAGDNELRGLLVEVDTGGSVTNLGDIITERGNTTLVGLAVNQSGRITATTSVNVNGSIRLLARDRTVVEQTQTNGVFKPVATRAGELVLGPDSITEIQLSTADETAVDGQPQIQSRVEAVGKTVKLEEGAKILAPGGKVDLLATSNPRQPMSGRDVDAKIYLAEGSIIDVSGDTSALIAMERNQGTIKLFGNELADAPVQRDGPLARQPITVDLRRGTPLTDITPLRDQVKRTVGERMSAGGSVTLRSEGDVILQTGSTIDISGGQVEYLPGYLTPTKLTANGRVVDISEADPLLPYDGIVDSYTVKHDKWGVVETWSMGGRQFEAGYVEGKDAGSLSIEVRGGGVALAGDLRAQTTRGDWQVDPASLDIAGIDRPFTQVPLGGLLQMTGLSGAVLFRPTVPTQTFAFDTVVPNGLPMRLSQQLFTTSGINRFSVGTAGLIDISEDTRLTLDPGGVFAVSGSDVRVGGDIHIQSGTVSLAAGTPTQPGHLEVRSTASIDVSGGWVNDNALANDGIPQSNAQFIDGGSVALASQGDLTLAQGSSIDVSAGAALLVDDDLKFGAAGSIALGSKIQGDNRATVLDLQGDLLGYGFKQGGRLTLEAAGFLIGAGDVGEPPAAGTMTLAPDFFRQGGFSDFELVADRDSLVIAEGTQLILRPQNLQLVANPALQSTGTDLAAFTERVELPDYLRGTSSLTGKVERNSDVSGETAFVHVGAGAHIETGVGGAIGFSADSSVLIDGTLAAHGGNIDLALIEPVISANDTGYVAGQQIRLGSQGTLDVSGASRVFTDPAGYRSGDVLDGGVITLQADRGYILAASGSRMDISGDSDTLHIPAADSGQLAATAVSSSAGTLEVRAAEGGSLAGDIDARGGSAAVADGTLRIVMDGNARSSVGDIVETPFPTSRREIVVGSSRTVIDSAAAIPASQNGKFFLSTDTVEQSGFDVVDLTVAPLEILGGTNPGAIKLDGAVTLQADRRIDLDAAVLESSGGTATVNSALVVLGPTETLRRPQPAAATSGSGSVVVNAEHIDLVGDLVLRGFADVALNSSGDIRATGIRFSGDTSSTTFTLPGSLTTAADVLLRAAQVYPSTLTDYTFNVAGTEGRIAIESNGAAAVAPLSAAGSLTLSAAQIEQGGVLVAPFGTIDLNGSRSVDLLAGSVTSVSGAGATVPFGTTEFGQTWIYPLDSLAIRVLESAPDKRIALQAPEVNLAEGSLVDISGGGDLLTYEFVRGPGGLSDILLSDNPQGAFAILPAANPAFGVYDPLESKLAGIETGSTIHLAGGGGIPAGEYALLPARYALLPGAYLVTPVAGTQDISPSTAQLLADDATPVVAGKLGYAGVDTAASRWSGYAIESSAQLRQRAEYNVSLASTFFDASTVGMTADAGSLLIDADEQIRIDGMLSAASDGGRGALVDLVADNLAVVQARTDAADRVELVDSELQNFAAASVLLGGSRARDGDEVDLNVQASQVIVEAGSEIAASEVVLAATDTVTVAQGTRIAAVGEHDEAGPEQYNVAGDGTFVRVSTGDQVAVNRTNAAGQRGNVSIAEGAVLHATQSINLEASRDVVSAGDLVTPGGSLSLTASAISLSEGQPTQVTQGLTLSNADLARFQARELQLNSHSTIDISGAVDTRLDSVVLDAAGLRGVDNDGRTASLTANTLVLANSRDSVLASAGDGTGALSLSADSVELGAGAFDISGFDNVTLSAARQLSATDSGSLRVRGDLTLATPRITAGSGVDMAVAADGALATVALPAAADPQPAAGLGASLSMSAQSISHGGRIELPSGVVSLNATGAGGISLESGSSIDTAGRVAVFDDLQRGSPGGTVKLAADAGPVNVLDGATIDVSAAAAGGNAGRLEIAAENAAVQIGSAAVLNGHAGAGAQQGTFAVTAQSLGGTFSALNSQLNSGGFTHRRDVSLRTGDLSIAAADTVIANQLNIALDAGSIEVAGTIDAAGAEAGRVRLSAAGDITLLGSARIDAHATGRDRDGGEVELATRTGTISLANSGGLIDVSGTDNTGAAAQTGTVHLRAPRVGTDGVAIASLAASSIAGAERVDIEAFRTYESAVVDSALASTMAADTAAYMANAGAIETQLGIADDARYHLLAGEEIASVGDLAVSSDLDLFPRRYDGEAGVLTLRAAGDLRLNSSISDGLMQQEIFAGYPRDVVQAGDSWSYRLVGGARLGAADVLGTAADAGNVVVGSGAVVRTGTGDIEVAAGKDLVFTSADGAIYTVGENRGTGALDAEAAEVLLRGDFVENGGGVRVDVRGDVLGVTEQLLPDYMPRAAGEFVFYREGEIMPLAWAIDPAKFVHGIGALGGGNVAITAGGDVDSLTVALPTNAQPGAMDGSDLRIAGGGDLNIDAAGAIRGGNFLVGRGRADIVSGDSIERSASGLAPILQIADAQVALTARNNVEIATAFNPTVAEQDPSQGLTDIFFFGPPAYAFSYTDASALAITAIAGDVTIAAETTAIGDKLRLGGRAVPDPTVMAIFPGSLRASTFDGDIVIKGQIDLFPSAQGTLELLAASNVISGAADTKLLQSDADLAQLPSLAVPQEALFDTHRLLLGHAAIPVHATDTEPARIVAQRGNVEATGANTLELTLSEQARLYAGNDITDLGLAIQHNDPGDVSVIQAGRDIAYVANRRPTGNLVDKSRFSIDVAGPGRVDLIAGRDIDLGSSDGVRTRGDLSNAALADEGADINVLAGIAGKPDYDGFVTHYLQDDDGYASKLAAYLEQFAVNEALSDVENFRALDEIQQRAFILEVFFNELRESGIAASVDGDFSRGFDAIQALFPGDDYHGDLTSFLSQITTLDGGDINLVVPGGLVNAGVASSGTLSRPANRLGVIAQRAGDVNAFVKSDFLVNASRVFALDGGDVLIWSSDADIDAGRGAKSALAIPPPTVSFDAQGNTVVEFPPAVAGSGIRTAVSTPGRDPGDVYLFAPAGVVNAGDAGIDSAGNIVVAAVQVIGADNITAGGTSVGVPVDSGGLGASLTGVSAASSSASNAAMSEESTAGGDQESAPLADTAMSWLEVFVVGLGEENCKPDDLDCMKRQQ